MDNWLFKDLQQRVKELEQYNHLLQERLEHSEASRLELANSYEKQSRLMTQAIQDLEKAQIEAEIRNQDLQESLHSLQLMQTKLVASEKMSALGVLVAGIAHELNNPINFIYGNVSHAYSYVQSLIELLQLYQEIYPDPPDRIRQLSQKLDIEFIANDLFKLLNSMQLGSDRIRKLVVGLRTFSRLDEAEYKRADLHEGLDSTLMLLQHRLKGRSRHSGIQVVKHYRPLPKILCFPGLLNQVFMNILVNAIDAIEERQALQASNEDQEKIGSIEISTSVLDAGWIRISITDNGLGMSESAQRQVFNPFFTTKPPGKGTGIGMSISHQIIVERHGGRLDCFSEPGSGTTFVVHIPIQKDLCIGRSEEP